MLKNWEQIYRNSGAAQAVCVDVGGFRLSPVFHLFFYPGDPFSVVCLGSWTGLEISWRDRSAFVRELLLLLPGERQGWHKYCLILGVLAVLFSFLIHKIGWKCHLRWWLLGEAFPWSWLWGNRQGAAQQLQHETGSVKPPQKCLTCCSPDPWNDITDLFSNNPLILNTFWCIH